LYNEIKPPDDAPFSVEKSFSTIMRAIDTKYKSDNAAHGTRLTVMRNLFQLLTRVRGLEVNDSDMSSYDTLISDLQSRVNDEESSLIIPEFAQLDFRHIINGFRGKYALNKQ
jgi:hypothetical protein